MCFVHKLGKPVLPLNLTLNKISWVLFITHRPPRWEMFSLYQQGQLWEVKCIGVRLISPSSGVQLQHHQLDTEALCIKEFRMEWAIMVPVETWGLKLSISIQRVLRDPRTASYSVNTQYQPRYWPLRFSVGLQTPSLTSHSPGCTAHLIYTAAVPAQPVLINNSVIIW